ncbi:MAG: hypothetical protein ACKVT2_09060 [Saprospiraceae bacterium]
MKSGLGILFLLLNLLALPTNRAWACGNNNSEHAAKFHQDASEKSCCSEKGDQSSCTGDAENAHSGENCPCDHEKGDCHCPNCGTISHSGATFAAASTLFSDSILNGLAKKQSFYFAEHLPEDVHLPIWQPPKLVA